MITQRIIVFSVGVAVGAGGLLGCNVSVGDRSTADAEVLPLQLEPLPQEFVQRGMEWRKARRVPPGAHEVNLGVLPKEAALRLVFAPRSGTSLPRATVLVGGEQTDTVEVMNLDGWTSRRIDLSAHAGTECRVRFESRGPTWVAECELTPQPDPRPNVMVFLIDALRLDRLGCYGYGRGTSPNIDAFAKDAVRFTGAMSQSSWTRPSIASLITSTYPAVHGSNDRTDILRTDLLTLAEAMSAGGYRSHAVFGNPNLLPTWGLERGYDGYVDMDSMKVEAAKDGRIAEAAIESIQQLVGRKWFLYVHAMAPHSPYEPPSPYDARFKSDVSGLLTEEAERRRLSDAYDGEIAYSDAQFGRVMEALRASGQYDDALIVVLADHGEQMWEHGVLGHGNSLHDEELRIPLLVKAPGGAHAGETRDGLAEIIDVAPSILEWVGAPAPKTFAGRSLKARMEGGAAEERMGFASLYLEKYSQYSARDARYKYINDVGGGKKSWYDLVADPGETQPLTEAPAAAEPVARFAARTASGGEEGLHILVTGTLTEEHTVTGTVRAPGMGEPRLYYPAGNADVRREGDGLSFRVTTAPAADAPLGIVDWHESGGEQNNAHLTVDLPPDKPVELSLQLDGRPIPDGLVHVGREGQHRPVDGIEVTPPELVARSEDFDPVTLPRKLAIYVWYAAGPERVADENLEPEMANALEALGYL